MLPSRYRLKLPVSWNRNHPDKQANSKTFKIIAKENNSKANSRVGFIISAKVGKAVIRNRLRRNIESALKDKLESNQQGFDLIIIVHPDCAKATNEEISANLNQVLSKIHFS